MRQPIELKPHMTKMDVDDMKTGKVTPSVSRGMMLPAKAGTCEWCAVDHKPEDPHDATSLFYQYRFYNEHGRWPDWRDAMSHCTVELVKSWSSELAKLNIDINKGEVRPRSKK